MKRANKCVSKKPYALKSSALRYCKKVYLRDKTRLRFYECPSCLDFHITSKPPFRDMAAYYKKWDDEPRLLKAKRRQEHQAAVAKKALKKELEKQYLEFKRLFNKYCYDNGIHPGKVPTILKGVLPREERLRILAEMKKPWWRKMLDI